MIGVNKVEDHQLVRNQRFTRLSPNRCLHHLAIARTAVSAAFSRALSASPTKSYALINQRLVAKQETHRATTCACGFNRASLS